MHVDFSQLPETSRVWIYQANRSLSGREKKEAETMLHEFTSQWAAHGNPLKTSFIILNDRFLVLAADESYNGASGCSIDSSVHVVKAIGSKTGLDFFDRSIVCFWINDEIKDIFSHELKQKYLDGIWNAGTLTFNTLASTKKELDENWLVEAGNTWLRRYTTATAKV